MTKLLRPLFQTQLNNKQTSPAQFGQVKSGSNMSTNKGLQTISGNVEKALYEVSLTGAGPRKTPCDVCGSGPGSATSSQGLNISLMGYF